ncbi:SDR family NAD(P)-dependent oxidoreductase [Microbacterium sp. AGC85]
MRIDGASALVTGAAAGLGAATAARLAAAGATVIGIDLPQGIESAAPVDGVQYHAADVTSADDVQRAVAAARDIERPLRVVVNCAGIAPAARILSSRGVHDLEVFRRTLEINLLGTFNVLRLGAELMASQAGDEDGQRGLVINTASVAAYEGQIGQAAYAASKGGVVALTIAAARDLARSGIRVNTIAPGIVATPMLTSLGEEVGSSLARAVPFPSRLARPEEYAELVSMIVAHDYLNGETIRMDAALRMGPQ